MAAFCELLSEAIVPAALGLAVAIIASWGYQHLSARMAGLDLEMQTAVRDMPCWLARCESRL